MNLPLPTQGVVTTGPIFYFNQNFKKYSALLIQRKQTLYLIAVLIFNISVFFNSLYSKTIADPVGWISYGLPISITLSMVLAITGLLLYKNRTLQLKIVKSATYVQIVALGVGTGVFFSLGGFGIFLWQESVGLLLLLVSLIMYWLAGRGIKKDEELVQSMDRIR